MLFGVVRYLALLVSLTTAYHEVDHINISRSSNPKSSSRDSYLPRRYGSMLAVRNYDDFVNVLQPRGKSPPKATQRGGSPPSPLRQQPAISKASTSTKSGSPSTKSGSPSTPSSLARQPASNLERATAKEKISRTSSSSSGSKSPDGLYHNQFFKESQRIPLKQLHELFPASQARKLDLSVERSSKSSSKRLPSSVSGMEGLSIESHTRKSQRGDPGLNEMRKSSSPTLKPSESLDSLDQILNMLEAPHKQ